jgi:4-hydroxyphenylpyruvate dioxygenase-like putative hemolysin
VAVHLSVAGAQSCALYPCVCQGRAAVLTDAMRRLQKTFDEMLGHAEAQTKTVESLLTSLLYLLQKSESHVRKT